MKTFLFCRYYYASISCTFKRGTGADPEPENLNFEAQVRTRSVPLPLTTPSFLYIPDFSDLFFLENFPEKTKGTLLGCKIRKSECIRKLSLYKRTNSKIIRSLPSCETHIVCVTNMVIGKYIIVAKVFFTQYSP